MAGNGWSFPKTTFNPDAGTVYSPPRKPHGVGGLLHNFLQDVKETAYGIPFGIRDLAVGGYNYIEHGNSHELGKLWHQSVASYKYTYGSGNFHTIMHRIYEHPLGPVLDAVSIATLPFAGAGLAIKTADVAAELGTRVGLVSAESSGKLALTRLANRFRPGTEFTTRRIALPGAPKDVFKRYHPNPLIRTIQKQGTERLANRLALGSRTSKFFGAEGSIRRLGDRGYAERQIQIGRSRREVASIATRAREAKALADLRDHGFDPVFAAGEIGAHAYKVMAQTAEHVAPENRITKLVKNRKTGAEEVKLRGTGLMKGYTYQTAEEHFTIPELKSFEPNDVENWANVLSNKLTTSDPEKAAVDADGHYKIVRQKTKEDMLRAGIDTSKALYHFYTNPTKIWKWMILGTSPRYFINNVFGNSLMLAMSTNPVNTVRGIYHTTRAGMSKRHALRSLNEIERAVGHVTGDAIDRLLNTSSFATDVGSQLYDAKTRLGKLVARGPLYGVTHKWSDEVLRRIAVNGTIVSHPMYHEARRAANAQGLHRGAAHDAAVEMTLSDPQVRDLMYNKLDDMLGQYHYYNRAELAVRKVVPFYGWYRAIMRHAWANTSRHPGITGAYVRASSGETEDLKNLLGGKVPDFLLTSLPLSLLGGKTKIGSRIPVLSTTGLNPYSTIPQVADTAGALLGVPGAKPNEAVSSLVNPVAAGAAEWVTGTSLLTGAPIKRTPGGVLGSVGKNIATQTPGVRIVQTAISGPRKPKPGQELLYKGDLRQQLLGYIGYPEKEVSVSKMEDLYNREQGIHVPKTQFKSPPKHLKGWTTKKTGYHYHGGARKPSTSRSVSVRVPKARLKRTGLHRLSLGSHHHRKSILPKVNIGHVHHMNHIRKFHI